MPMHLVNKIGEPNSHEERFVDVFDGGRLLTRSAQHQSLAAWMLSELVFVPNLAGAQRALGCCRDVAEVRLFQAW
jgi:hypothetical protein